MDQAKVEVKQTFYDTVTRTVARLIGIVAPESAQRYVANRYALRGYLAATNKGVDRAFRPAQTSGAQEITESWQSVTNKSRALDRDNAYVSGMRKRFVAAVVGEGSWPRPKTFKKSRFDLNKELNTMILWLWEHFSKDACANGDSIYQLQRIAAKHYFVDGTFLIRKVFIAGADGKKTLKLEGLEADHLDTMKDVDDGVNRVVNGIKLDQYNKPLGYWIKKRFPTEFDSASIFVPADEVIHLFDRNRVSDVTGMCQFASVVANLYSIGEYRNATMNLARVATGFGVFVETNSPGDYGQGNSATEGKDEAGVPYAHVIPGGVHYMRPGEKITQVKPESPGSQYEGFVRNELQAASVGAGMSYESISNDGSRSNFSSTRQMLLFERAMARYTFSLFEEQFYNKVYKWFIEFHREFGKLGSMMPKYEDEMGRYLAVNWSRPKTEWVDPLKDVKSAAAEVQLGINTLSNLSETAGRDIEETVATLAYEKELFESNGLVYPNAATIVTGQLQPGGAAPAIDETETEGQDAK